MLRIKVTDLELYIHSLTVKLLTQFTNMQTLKKIYIATRERSKLTHNIEEDSMSDGWCGRDLTLVLAGVASLWTADSKRPLLGARLVLRLEPLIRRVSISSHSQQMDISMPHP